MTPVVGAAGEVPRSAAGGALFLETLQRPASDREEDQELSGGFTVRPGQLDSTAEGSQQLVPCAGRAGRLPGWTLHQLRHSMLTHEAETAPIRCPR